MAMSCSAPGPIIASAVRSCVLLSLNTPVAVNCTLPFLPTTGSAGVTTIEVTVAGVTVSRAVAESEPYVTVIVVWPAPIPVASPLVFALAAAGVDELHASPAESG